MDFNAQTIRLKEDFEKILSDHSFALIERDGAVFILCGEMRACQTLEELQLLGETQAKPIAFALPYRIIQEKGFEARGEEPILALVAEHVYRCEWDLLREFLPDTPVVLADEVQASMSDADYAEMVEHFQRQEIEGGNCSQTTLSRKFSGHLHHYDLQQVLSLYRSILFPQGQYMTILFCDRRQDPQHPHCLIGATPERHLTVTPEHALMIPIAGTLRKEDEQTFETRLHQFVSDPKEINELFQVVDEELKMMGRICPTGGTIHGPYLREIGSVVHTEYELYGNRGLQPIDALRLTLHAPTVVGGPMESAARIIAKYEPESRRYYAGEIGIFLPESASESGRSELDCAIALRCAEIFENGLFTIQAGGGLVRDSDPFNEARESRAKAMGMLAFLLNEPNTGARYLTQDRQKNVETILQDRNQYLSHFWMESQEQIWRQGSDKNRDVTILIVNNEDDFAHMIAHVCRGLGYCVEVKDTFEVAPQAYEYDIVILGPGPGDPNDSRHPRMLKLREFAQTLMDQNRAVLGVCLGHQILSFLSGIPVERQPQSTQGMQQRVSIQKTSHTLGFYNSFSPVWRADQPLPDNVDVETDELDRIIYMQGNGFIGFQFHPESVMSQTGVDLLKKALNKLCYERGSGWSG